MAKADTIFINNCRDILYNGFSTETEINRPVWSDGSAAYTKKIFCIINKYDLSKEFPLLTLRPINFKAAIDEILWIWQKKSNNIKELNSSIWNQWADKNGSIGKAYGYQLAKKNKYKEGMFDQVDRVLFDLKENPYSRRIMTNIYNFDDLNEMNLYPCAYSTTFNVVNGKLNMILNQRSNDMLVANNWNVVQYSVLLHMFAQVSNLEVGTLVHVIADAHIYDKHFNLIKELLSRPSFKAPIFKINKKINNFYDFTIDDFSIKQYMHGEAMKNIPVSI